MHLQPKPLLLLLAAPLLLAAGAGCHHKASWNSPEEALTAGVQATAEGDTKDAVSAFTEAAKSSNAATRYKANLYLGAAQAHQGETEKAKEAFAQAEKDSQFNAEGAQQIAEAWMLGGQLDLADAAVASGKSRFPERASIFENVTKAIEAKRSGDDSALAELGYSGK